MLLWGFEQRTLLPEDRFAGVKAPDQRISNSPGFHTEWVQFCGGEGPATCDCSHSGPMAEIVLLGNLTYRAGVFDWDTSMMSTGSNEKVTALLQTEYRRGWEV